MRPPYLLLWLSNWLEASPRRWLIIALVIIALALLSTILRGSR